MENSTKLPILNRSQNLSDDRARAGLNRRQVVQRLLGTAGAGLALPGMAAAESAHPVHKHVMSASTMEAAEEQAAAAEWKPLFLDPHQNETLIVLAERIVPNSTNAQVNRFVDLLLSVDTLENQQKFLNALSAFDAESLKLHPKPFKALTEEQQNAILTDASTAKPGKGEGGSPGWFSATGTDKAETAPDTMRDYFENLKQWVSGAYYSSEVGMKELGWTGQVAWDSFPGCQHPEGHQ